MGVNNPAEADEEVEMGGTLKKPKLGEEFEEIGTIGIGTVYNYNTKDFINGDTKSLVKVQHFFMRKFEFECGIVRILSPADL
jgi:hypothetical protein